MVGRITSVIAIICIAYLFQIYRNFSKSTIRLEFNTTEYWGRGSATNYCENTQIKPFDITYGPDKIEDLRRKLNENIVLHAPLEGVGFQYGMNSKKLTEVIKYWRDSYLPKWTKRAAFLKSLPHFQTQIQGLNIHYIHKRPTNLSAGKRIVPLLLLHGWPSSVREFYDMIRKLTEQQKELNIEWEIIAPSLPGYGWSDAPQKIGFGVAEMSVVLRNLMIRLGFNRFYIHGDDWGSFAGSGISTIFPENVYGFHTNMCFIQSLSSVFKLFIASVYPSYFIPEEYLDFVFPLSTRWANVMEETGYMHLQATKPDTIGAALTNNPIGLAAYILEKFSTWTNPEYKLLADGGLEKDFTIDALLDNIMIYYMTNSITTSMRMYSVVLTKDNFYNNLDRLPMDVPTGCARFKHDIAHCLDWQLADKFRNIVQSTYYKNGGHFASLQLPDIVYTDFIEFVKKVESRK